MDRRNSVLALLAITGAGISLSVRAQQPQSPKPYVIGLLPDFSVPSPALGRLVEGLAKFGRVEGRDYVFYRSGVRYGGDTKLALDRVMQAKPDLIVATNLGFAIAANRATKAIPIVMWISGFPVEGGVADSLNRPGRNVTGMTVYAGGEHFAKLVQLVHEAKPGVRRIGAFMSYVPPFHPRAETDLINRGMLAAAEPLGIELKVFEIAKPGQIDEALAAVVAQGLEALVLTSDVVMVPRLKEIFQFAVARRLPAIIDAPWGELGEPQPLLTYMASFGALMRQVAPYINQILWNGANPGDLPIQLPAQFEFVVSLKTAKAIGLTVPPAILVRADQVIE